MVRRTLYIFVFLGVVAGSFIVLIDQKNREESLSISQVQPFQESNVQQIPLAAPLNHREAQISGMDWCAGRLILLPQYPDFASTLGQQAEDRSSISSFAETQQVPSISYLYAIEESDLADYISGISLDPILAKPLFLNENGVRNAISNFEGFESIACNKGEIWLGIEAAAEEGDFKNTFLVSAKLESDQVVIKPDLMHHFASNSMLPNASNEALIFDGNSVVSIHEINSHELIEQPTVSVIDLDTGERSQRLFPNIPFRITDATKLDGNKRFWAPNYFYENDNFMEVGVDPITEIYGEGETHRSNATVERLLEFTLRDSEIELSGTPPIQLRLIGREGRNWEGIARYQDKGLLIITDKFPTTQLAYVPFLPITKIAPQ